jgi:DNA mismatch repair protein MutH
MFRDKFDPHSQEDIQRYARQLIGRTLRLVAEIPENEINKRAKGRIGNLVEKYYFGYEPNNNPEPDFPDAQLELKVTGLKSAGPGQPKAKERLSLNQINFENLVHETFESSSFYQKCRNILIICYLYDQSKSDLDQVFTENQFVFRLDDAELAQIKRDWETIQTKVKAGFAHEISEGDTFLLKASRKGSGGPNEKKKSQPFSNVGASSRAWSFSSSYLTKLIAESINSNPSTQDGLTLDFETETAQIFRAYLGTETDTLFSKFAVNSRAKSARKNLLNKILVANGLTKNDLKVAGIRLKTVRAKFSGKPREAMSFAHFDYKEIADQSWFESDFADALEDKFLIAVFQEDAEGVERLSKIAYWNLPFDDRLSAQNVWEEVKRRILDGNYVFPQASSTAVAHVRPHGANAKDLILCPDGEYRMKRSFWLNKNYIEKVIAAL